jgi:dephospho-CoA kinase
VLRVGLTGGIAAGKSTVASMFAELGATIVDADVLSREVVMPGRAAHAAVVARFGASVLAGDGSIDRTALARVVFADSAARRDLERIVHPEVLAEADRRIGRAADEGADVTILDAALLVETGAWRTLDRLIVVHCPPALQLERLRQRGLTEAEARARLDAQAPLAEKLAAADFRIDTSGTLEATREEAEDVWRRLLQEAERAG